METAAATCQESEMPQLLMKFFAQGICSPPAYCVVTLCGEFLLFRWIFVPLLCSQTPCVYSSLSSPQRGIEMGMVIVIVKLNHHAFF